MALLSIGDKSQQLLSENTSYVMPLPLIGIGSELLSAVNPVFTLSSLPRSEQIYKGILLFFAAFSGVTGGMPHQLILPSKQNFRDAEVIVFTERVASYFGGKDAAWLWLYCLALKGAYQAWFRPQAKKTGNTPKELFCCENAAVEESILEYLRPFLPEKTSAGIRLLFLKFIKSLLLTELEKINPTITTVDNKVVIGYRSSGILELCWVELMDLMRRRSYVNTCMICGRLFIIIKQVGKRLCGREECKGIYDIRRREQMRREGITTRDGRTYSYKDYMRMAQQKSRAKRKKKETI